MEKKQKLRNSFKKRRINVKNIAMVTILVGVVILGLFSMLKKNYNVSLRYRVCNEFLWSDDKDEFEGFDNVSGIQTGAYIVPNYVHFLRYGDNLKELNIMDAINIMAAYKNQNPDKLFIHTNLVNFTGKYWDSLLKTPGFKDTIQLEYIKPLDKVFGQKLSSWYKAWHGSDLLRIDILRRFGGIFLDNDVYLVKNMDKFRKFEMSVSIIDTEKFGTMTLVAHKDARFLRQWLESYRNDYYAHLWYYNAGEKPMREIIHVRPELIHAVYDEFGVQDLRPELYVQNWPEWKDQYTIHTMIRHLHDHDALLHNKVNLKYPVIFNENNLLTYNVTILEMAMDCCRVFFDRIPQ